MEKIKNKKQISFFLGSVYLILAGLILLSPAVFVYWDLQKISLSEDLLVKQKKEEENQIFQKSSIKFSYFTDAHCYGKTKKESETVDLNWRCLKPIYEMNRRTKSFGSEFIFDGGDLIDGRDKRSAEDFVEIRKILLRNGLPFYQMVGNHETRSFEKKDWLAMTENKKTYYYFDIREYRFVVLDGNFFINDGKEKDTFPGKEFYPGLINKQQLKWLRRILAQARNRTTIVFLHQPPIDGTFIKDQSMFLANRKVLQEIFSQYGVKAVFSGHIEELCSQTISGVDYYLMAGFWKPNLGYSRRFKDEGFFYQIEIDEEKKLKIEVFLSSDKEANYESFQFDKERMSCDNSGKDQVKRIDSLLPMKIERTITEKEDFLEEGGETIELED